MTTKQDTMLKTSQISSTTKGAQFFSQDEDERVRHMAEVDRLCEILGAEQLVELNAAFEKAQV